MRPSICLLWLVVAGAGCATTSPPTPEPSCPAASLACAGSCIDPSSDGTNCGGCGNACPAGLVCGAGQCQAHCPTALSLCGQSCLDLSQNPSHCGDCAVSCASNESCQSSVCVAALGSQSNPAVSCLDLHRRLPAAADGSYFILSASGTPLAVSCDMTTDGGGYTQLTTEVVATLAAADRSYLYKQGASWYRSPTTQLIWSWTVPQELRGSYSYFDAVAQRQSSFNCTGSADQPQFGIGCSNGPSSLRLVPRGAESPAAGSCTVCQDLPGIFASKCAVAVTIWVR